MNINKILKDYTELIQYSNFTLSDDKYNNINEEKNKDNNTLYYLNDSTYGSFNCIIFDHAVPNIILLYLNQHVIQLMLYQIIAYYLIWLSGNGYILKILVLIQ